MNRPRIVIVGAGFAGLATAKMLAKEDVDVTILDQNNFHTFLPLLYQVATAGLEPADVAYPVRTIFGNAPNVQFRHGQVVRFDVSRRLVHLADDTSIGYDFLVVASGAGASFAKVAGAERFSFPLYTLRDARRLRNHLLSFLEDVDAHPERYGGASQEQRSAPGPSKRRRRRGSLEKVQANQGAGAPVIVVIGGGPTGVETAGAIVELLDVAVRRDRLRIDRARTKVILIDVADRLLTAFSERASRYAVRQLDKRGVEIRLGVAVEEVTGAGIRLAGGESIQAGAVIWAGGVGVNGTVAASLPGERDRGGRIIVEPELSLPGFPEVFVIGDAAAVRSVSRRFPGSDEDASSQLCPQVAQVAIQSGRQAARQILLRCSGSRTGAEVAFSYKDKGIMATIGRRAAVAQLARGPLLTGTVGWLAWLGLHLVYLIGFRNRLSVLVNWLWRYLEWPSGPRLIVTDEAPNTVRTSHGDEA